MRLLTIVSLSAAPLALAFAAPAMAHPDAMPMGEMPPPPPQMEHAMHGDMAPDVRPDWNQRDEMHAHHQRMRADWLDQCRQQYRGGDNGVGGALIGGAVGGLIGNRIAGRGHRVVGTVLGAGAGAVAGAIIDRAEDRADNRGPSRDYCESYLDYYSQAQGSYGYGYGQPMMMVPVMMVPVMTVSGPQSQRQQCTETVTTVEEWVTVPARHRTIPARRIYHDKRVRIVPTKRVSM